MKGFTPEQDGWFRKTSKTRVSDPTFRKLILRSQDGFPIQSFLPRDLRHELCLQAQLTPNEAAELKVSLLPGKNIAILLAQEASAISKLKNCSFVTLNGKQQRISVYEAANRESCKGVIHGVAANTSPEFLLKHLKAVGYEILAARMMGSTQTAIITFSGTYVPVEVDYDGGLHRCTPHKPRAQYCTKCLKLGHRADVCTQVSHPLCPKCGSAKKDEEHECITKCALCGGPHPSEDKECKVRREADAVTRLQAYQKRLAIRKATESPKGSMSQRETPTKNDKATTEQASQKPPLKNAKASTEQASHQHRASTSTGLMQVPKPPQEHRTGQVSQPLPAVKNRRETNARYASFAHALKGKHTQDTTPDNTPEHIPMNLEGGTQEDPTSECANMDAESVNIARDTEQAPLAKRSRSTTPSRPSSTRSHELSKRMEALEKQIAENEKQMEHLLENNTKMCEQANALQAACLTLQRNFEAQAQSIAALTNLITQQEQTFEARVLKAISPLFTRVEQIACHLQLPPIPSYDENTQQ